MTAWWVAWATQVALALRFGMMDLLEQMLRLAFYVALATLERLGIRYGARLA